MINETPASRAARATRAQSASPRASTTPRRRLSVSTAPPNLTTATLGMREVSRRRVPNARDIATPMTLARAPTRGTASTRARVNAPARRRADATTRASAATRGRPLRAFDGAAWARAACGIAACGVVAALAPQARAEFYIEDVPSGLRASEGDARARRSLKSLTSGPNGRAVEKCANRCLATCARGGGGGPGLGPASVRRDPIVFKDSFRSREYCLFECADICSRSLEGKGR